MRSLDSFAEQDRLDHDAAIAAIRFNLNGAAHRVWFTGRVLIDVVNRELYRLSGLDSVGAWTKRHFGFEYEQAKDYIDCFLSLSEEFVLGRDISLDGLLVIIHASGKVQAALMKHAGISRRRDPLWAARMAGEKAERAGEDIDKAVKDAFAGLPYTGTTVSEVEGLESCLKKLVRGTGKEGDLLEKVMGKVLGGEKVKKETLWGELFQRVDRMAMLKEELARKLEDPIAVGVTVAQPVPKPAPQKAASAAPPNTAPPPPTPTPHPQAGPETNRPSRRAPDRDEAGREGGDTAAKPAQNAGGTPPQSDNPTKSQEGPSKTEPVVNDAPTRPEVLPKEQVRQIMVQAITASLLPEEQQELEGHLNQVLRGKPIGAVDSYLRGLFAPCQRQEPGVPRPVFDTWLCGMLDPDFENRWDYVLDFSLAAMLPGFEMHLELLAVYPTLPEKQRQIADEWDTRVTCSEKAMAAMLREADEKYGHLFR